MRRREFITLIGSAPVAWPPAARAQQTAMPLIGFLHQASAEETAAPRGAFEKGLQQAGFSENQTSRLNTGGLRITMIDCRSWQLIWFVGR